MTKIFITRDAATGVGRLRFHYDPDVVDLIKRFVSPTKRSWTASTKSWTVDLTALDDLVVHLRRRGHAVDDADAPDARPGSGWATVLFLAVGPERVEPVFKALTRVLHPDVGTGDTVLMQDLNTARGSLPSSSSRRRSA